MKIESIYIDGYRRFKNQTIRLEGQSTVVAGANNSGKTSLVDLLRVVLGAEGGFRADDLSAEGRMTWLRTVIEAALAGEEYFHSLFEEENISEKAPSIEVRVEVKYDPSADDIREFADYLMDLDAEKSAFYFLYKFHQKVDNLSAAYKLLYPVIRTAIEKNGWVTFSTIDLASPSFLALQSLIDTATLDSSQSDVFFTDESFSNLIAIDSAKKFAQLFNFRAIKASRTLDDTNEDKSRALNNRLVAVAKEDEKWATLLADFPDQIIDAINSTGIRKLTSDETLKSLNQVIDSISKTNGTSQSDLFIDFEMTDEHAVQLISRSMQTRYLGEGVPLGESSQGLGYSNLIYLHLETESFIRSAATPENKLLVNLLILEEPESHMHPQMQNAFIGHLFSRVKEVDCLQGLVTTHSNEIIRSSEIQQLRVLKTEDGQGRVIDLRKFHESEVKDKSTETQRLFNLLYSINFSDILFADKVIMYEGDTERMYIQALIKEREDLSRLRTQYISYVQVGGAYAHVYKPLIVDTLHLKTVIITDIDYQKDSVASNPQDIEALTTSNATLTEFFGEEIEDKKLPPSVKQLLERISEEDDLAMTAGIQSAAVAFQSANEGYARTLEEAILATLTGTNVWETKTAKEWRDYRGTSSLKFSVPRAENPSIREVVASTAGNKTDFMYSLLVTTEFKGKVPAYILAALQWLSS